MESIPLVIVHDVATHLSFMTHIFSGGSFNCSYHVVVVPLVVVHINVTHIRTTSNCPLFQNIKKTTFDPQFYISGFA